MFSYVFVGHFGCLCSGGECHKCHKLAMQEVCLWFHGCKCGRGWPMSGPQLGSSMCIQGATPFHWHRAADGQQGLDHQLWPLVRVTLLHAGVCFQQSSCDNVCGFGLSTDHPRYCLGPFSHQTGTRMKCLRPQKLPRQHQPGARICMHGCAFVNNHGMANMQWWLPVPTKLCTYAVL